MPPTAVRQPAPHPPSAEPRLGRWRRTPVWLRRLVVLVVGPLLILVGCVLIVLPGPFTIPPILLGLAVLGSEFAWARRLRLRVMDLAQRTLRELWRQVRR